MFNVTVIKARDIIKYMIELGIIIVGVLFLKEIIVLDKINTNITDINIKEKLQETVSENIPLITQASKNDENTEEKNKEDNLLEYIIENQLNVSQFIVQKEIKDNNTSNDIQNEDMKNIKQAKTGVKTEILPSIVPDSYTNTYDNVEIKNESDNEITDEMLDIDVNINNKNVIIFHTHTCESYTPTQNYQYDESGTFRTIDLNCNVTRVGDELTNQLNSYNYNVIHDKTYHDYPAYNGSYGRSLETVENILKENKDTDLIIDIHRDAIGDFTYAPTVKIGDEEAARLMFVIGTDGGGLEHPNWNQNLKFAIKLQEKANELYPGLFRPIIVRNSRYNQHLGKAASIIEVGSTGNTMEQCLTSMKYLAKVINETLK